MGDAFTDAEIARLFQLVALLLFLAPAVLVLSREHRRLALIGSAVVLGLGLIWAMVKVVLSLIA